MDLGIVIVNWNVRDLLAACLDSVYVDLAQSGLSGSVVVVDNGSTDGSVEMLRANFPRTALIQAENRGMGAGNNLGLRALGFGDKPSAITRSDQRSAPFAVLILNPDTVVKPGTLRTLVSFLRDHPRAGFAAPKLLNGDGTLQHSGFRFPGLVQAALDLFPPPGRLARLIDSPLNGRYPASWYASGTAFQVDHTLGAAVAVRGEAIQGRDLFDEVFHMYCEEIDAQWRLAGAGWERWVVPGAEVIHYGGRSTGQIKSQSFVNLWTSRRRLYYRYHSPLLNVLVRLLVEAAMRQHIRENHRLSQRGQLSPDRRAEINQALTEVIQEWQRRRPSVKREA
jgi:hypothetical protein